jgi:hypothetical protein
MYTLSIFLYFFIMMLTVTFKLFTVAFNRSKIVPCISFLGASIHVSWLSEYQKV